MNEAKSESGICIWAISSPAMKAYHDHEWGRPVIDEQKMFERLCLESFQAGLSWALVLARREALRLAFANFDFEVLAKCNEVEIEEAMLVPGMIRNRAKIAAVFANARALKSLHSQGDTLTGVVWQCVSTSEVPPSIAKDVPVRSASSTNLSAALRDFGFTFIGPVTAYATLQAAGVVNDHLVSCPVRGDVEVLRRLTIAAMGP